LLALMAMAPDNEPSGGYFVNHKVAGKNLGSEGGQSPLG